MDGEDTQGVLDRERGDASGPEVAVGCKYLKICGDTSSRRGVEAGDGEEGLHDLWCLLR